MLFRRFDYRGSGDVSGCQALKDILFFILFYSYCETTDRDLQQIICDFSPLRRYLQRKLVRTQRRIRTGRRSETSGEGARLYGDLGTYSPRGFLFLGTLEIPFPMISRGKFHKSQYEKKANYLVTLLFIFQPLVLLV